MKRYEIWATPLTSSQESDPFLNDLGEGYSFSTYQRSDAHIRIYGHPYEGRPGMILVKTVEVADDVDLGKCWFPEDSGYQLMHDILREFSANRAKVTA